MAGCGTGNRPSAEHEHGTEAHEHEHDGHEHGHDHACEHDHEIHEEHVHADHDHHAEEPDAHRHSHEAEGHDHASEAAGHEEHEGHDHEAHAGEIVFTKAQASRTDFALYEVVPVTFNEIIATGGRIMPAQGDEASVVAPVSGIVAFSGKKLADGTPVKKGEGLFSISSKEIAEGDYTARTEAAYRQAEAAYERAEALVADKIVSQAEYEQKRLDYENARTAYEALASKLSAQGTGVSAPIGGFVKNIAVSEGQFVEVGQTLATVSQNRRLVLRAEVSQRYLADLRNVSSANFRTPYDGKLHTLAAMNGRLLSVGKNSDGNSVFVPVTFEFDNTGDIVPGSFVEIYLISSPVADALTVPLSAVTEEQGVHYVFVRLDEEGYLKREVKLGADDGEYIRVLSGLSAGETVVSRGVAQVKAASFSGAIPHGHSHSH
mgnify:CR=1 FL=1